MDDDDDGDDVNEDDDDLTVDSSGRERWQQLPLRLDCTNKRRQ